MNLITTKWIPVRSKNNDVNLVTPYELTANYETNPINDLAANRYDFNGALAQFLIGLLQTALPNLSKREWQQWHNTPPSTDELKKLLLPLEDSFKLFANGPQFMQDLESLSGERKPISTLLIEQPGKQTLEQNADHFIKRNRIKQLCLPCATTALFTLQINAPSGGAGHRTSIRGGGPLTTLVVSTNQQYQTLWHKVWYNVLTQDEFRQHQSMDNTYQYDYNAIFPWCRKTIDSTNDTEIVPSETHPFQIYWCMPRRIRLILKKDKKTSCSLCGNICLETIHEYITKNYGNKYSEHWQHPLSPYYIKNNQRFPTHPHPGGIGYRHWLALTLGEQETGNHKKLPAATVTVNEKRIANDNDGDLKIWAFGYDMDNMKARCWYESHLPIYHLSSKENSNILPTIIYGLINTAEQARSHLSQALKRCSHNYSTDASNYELWQRTENYFYYILKKIINSATHDELEKNKRDWLAHVQEQTLNVFFSIVKIYNYGSRNTEKTIEAENKLRSYLYGKKIHQPLCLEKISGEFYEK